ncbi:hypothetical protein ACWDSL_13710 [Streptomyces sp. NPDC000941]
MSELGATPGGADAPPPPPPPPVDAKASRGGDVPEPEHATDEQPRPAAEELADGDVGTDEVQTERPAAEDPPLVPDTPEPAGEVTGEQPGRQEADARTPDPDRPGRAETGPQAAPEAGVAGNSGSESNPHDELGDAMGGLAESTAKAVETGADATVDLVEQAADAVDEAAAGASFDASADAFRAGADGDRMPEMRSDAVPPPNGAPADGEWEDGDPPAEYAGEREQTGTLEGPPTNPWLNLGRQSADAETETDSGGAGVPPDDPGAPGSAAGADDPDPDDGGTPGEHPWRQFFRPQPADTYTTDAPPDPGAPPGDDRNGGDEDGPDTYMKELKIEGLELNADVERMRGANMARAVAAQEAYEASRSAQGRAGQDQAAEGREGQGQERGERQGPSARDAEAARVVEIAAQGFSSVRDVDRAAVNHARSVSEATPAVTQALQRSLEQRRGLGLGKDIGPR